MWLAGSGYGGTDVLVLPMLKPIRREALKPLL